MRIFLTGASGFIGRELCLQLSAAGHQISALVRREGSQPPGTSPVRGELTDAQTLREALAAERPQCVIHLAAEIASQRNAAKIQAVNVAGTASLLDACRETPRAGEPQPRIVFASTVVTGDALGALLTEDTPLPVHTAYGRSKHQGEQMVLQSGLPAVVIRPSHVYGAGSWYESEIVARLRSPGRFAQIGAGENLWDVVRVEDVASAILAAVASAPDGAIYHVVDDEPITYRQFMRLTADALGLGAPRRVPVALARLIAGAGAVDALLRSARSSNAKLKRELGWHPRWPRASEGIPDAVARITASP
ncbi:MAG TPA: NAD(P)-dependent oxidoreductase [Solirubrobacteraceae bacterium]|jgi:nucleoside-diphosphate-sugar epimerase